MFKLITFYTLVIFSFSQLNLFAQDKLLTILEEELQREFKALSNEDVAPYYIEYRVEEINILKITASFGSLMSFNKNKSRILSIAVRVGDYSLDNTHISSNQFFNPGSHSINSNIIPIEDEPLAIKNVIWQTTNDAYNNALINYKLVKDNLKNSINENIIPDFSSETPVQYFEEPISLEFDEIKWKDNVKLFSSKFLKDTSIFYCNVGLDIITNRKYFVSTEKTKIIQNKIYTTLSIIATIRATDGNVIPYFMQYNATTLNELPETNSILSDIDYMIAKLQDLKNAPLAEAYTGPAILSAKSTGVFFHEIFGHRVEGHRMRNIFDGHTYKDKLNTMVLPKYISLNYNPTCEDFQDKKLIGSYKYDDQGVKSREVRIVNNGILENFLMSRQPMEHFTNSNGHGRAQAGMPVVSRQSNMFIETSKPLSKKTLRKKLIKECKKQNIEYGYYFKEVFGGFTFTNRFMPNVFNIFPFEVYRIYVDGRPDELVNGIQLVGTPLLMFSKIEGTGDTYEIFNGYCGAESGNVPTSTIAPSLFIKQIEIQKSPSSFIDLPILPRPDR